MLEALDKMAVFAPKNLLSSKKSSINHEVMNIFASDVLADIRSGKAGWEEMVPGKVGAVVRGEGLFLP